MARNQQTPTPTVKVINQKIRRVGRRFGTESLPYQQLIADIDRDFLGQTHLTKDGILQINSGKKTAINDYQAQTLVKISRRAGVKEIVNKSKERLEKEGIKRPTAEQINQDVEKFTKRQEKFDKTLDLIYDHETAGDLPTDINNVYRKIYRTGAGTGSGVTNDDIDYLENAIEEFEELREQIENIVQDLYRFQAQYNAHNPDNRFYLPDNLKLDNRNIVSGQYDMNTIRDTVERLNDYHTALFTADDPHEVEY